MLWKHGRRLIWPLAPLLIVSLHGPLFGQEQLKVHELAPHALAAGTKTTVSFLTKGRPEGLSLEVSPPEGISPVEVRPLAIEDLRKEFAGWEADVKVDAGAALGNRLLTVITPSMRSKAERIEVVAEVPRVSDLLVTTERCSGGQTSIDYNFIVIGRRVDVKSIKTTGFGKARSGGLKVIEEHPYGGGVHYLGQAYKTEPAAEGRTKVYGRSCTSILWGQAWTLGVSVEDEHGYQSNRLSVKAGTDAP